MKSLVSIVESLLDQDFDITDNDILPPVGQVVVDRLSKIDYKFGLSHNEGHGWLCDWNKLHEAMLDIAHWMKTHHKGKISKKDAYSYMWATGANANEDVCLICVLGDLNAPKSLGIGRPSTCDGILCTASRGYNSAGWVEQGIIKDSQIQSHENNRRTIYRYIEDVANNSIKRKFYLLPGYCYDLIKNQILK